MLGHAFGLHNNYFHCCMAAFSVNKTMAWSRVAWHFFSYKQRQGVKNMSVNQETVSSGSYPSIMLMTVVLRYYFKSVVILKCVFGSAPNKYDVFFSNIMSTRNRFAALVPVSTLVCLDRFTTIPALILTYSQCVNNMIISIRLDHGEGLVASFFINASLFVFYTCYTHVIR